MVAQTEVLTIKIEKKNGQMHLQEVVVSQGGWEPRKHKLSLTAQKEPSARSQSLLHLCF